MGNEYFTDARDGQKYRTVKIGSQVWMAENLNYKTAGSWCYDDKESNGKKYGRLYTWEAAKTVCPTGWHLPTRQEWDSLIATVGDWSAYRLKAKKGWVKEAWSGNVSLGKVKNGNGGDIYGFSALPGGCHVVRGFFNIGENGDWWTATELDSNRVYHKFMLYSDDNVGTGNFDKSDGLSVRYVQNN